MNNLRSEILRHINQIMLHTSSKYLDEVILRKNLILDSIDELACKNCQYYEVYGNRDDIGFCMRHTRSKLKENTVEEDWFCAGFYDDKKDKKWMK